MSLNKILLLDSNSLMHRAYHALPNLKTSNGMYTGAIFGFLNILLRLIKEQQPTHIAAAFDLKGPTFRHAMYADYKATRKPMDEELRVQVEPLKDIIAAMGIKIVSLEGYEGDDILGTLSRRFDDECIIVTGDRDSFQLVSPTTKVFWTKKGVTEIEVYDEGRLLDDGFTPSQFIDYKALMGDASDNIPGVAGVGEKTARSLLEEYGSLDAVLDAAPNIKGRLGENLRNGRDIALLSRELATIKLDVPVDCTLDDIAFTPLYSLEVKRRLMELEMPTLAGRMRFDESDVQETAHYQKEVKPISCAEDIEGALEGKSEFSLLIGEDITFAVDATTEYKIECAQNLFSLGIVFDDAIDALRKAAESRKLVCYDYKSLSKQYDIHAKDIFDIMIAAHLARESAPMKGVEQAMSADGFTAGAAEMFAEKEMLQRQLTEKGLDRLFYEVELPLCVVLRNMETRGVRVSAEALKQLERKYSDIINDLSARIFELAGVTFNIASPKQLGEILFDKLGLRHGKRTKTGYSVSEDVLLGIADRHPIVPLILEYRKFTKLQSTYVVGMQPLIVRGRIHTEFNQCVTATGRLSSTNPNLQNIPTRSEEAKDIKQAFVPADGCVFVSADYSQIELRLLAHFSGDEQLIEAFNSGDDIHAMTASRILGKRIEDVTPAERRDAKAVNFGIIYGISGYGLAENLSIPQQVARAYIDNYFLMHPKVREFMDECVDIARERGYAVTLLGRRRNLTDLKATNYAVRSAAERMAMNTPLQGSAADIIKLAMLGVERRLKDMKSKMILQIHDELIIEAAEDEAEQVRRILQEEMQGAYALRVPLIAEANVAKNWAELK